MGRERGKHRGRRWSEENASTLSRFWGLLLRQIVFGCSETLSSQVSDTYRYVESNADRFDRRKCSEAGVPFHGNGSMYRAVQRTFSACLMPFFRTPQVNTSITLGLTEHQGEQDHAASYRAVRAANPCWPSGPSPSVR